MSRSSNRHLFNFLVFSFFVLAFSAYLVITAWYFARGADHVSIKSFTPGLPAFFLFFLARKEWRAMRAARNMERRRLGR